jgi:hypothetical protein
MVLQFRPRSPLQVRQRESLDFRQCHLGAVCNIRYPKATLIEFVAYLIDAFLRTSLPSSITNATAKYRIVFTAPLLRVFQFGVLGC